MNEKVKMKTGEHIMKIILFQSTTDSLNTFAKLMAEGFKQAGYDILLTDMQNEQITRQAVQSFTIPGKTAALFFNHCGMNLFSEDHDIIWNRLDIDCYDLIVDHPMYYHAAIMYPIRHLTFLCVDQYHQKFIERFYHGKVRSVFFPLAGIASTGPAIPFEERSMDLLFTGAYLIDRDIEYHTQGLSPAMKNIWLECFTMLKTNPYLTLEQAVERCFTKKGVVLPDDDLRDLVRLFQDMDGMLRSYAREHVIRTLANHDIKIHIYGEGWEYLDCKQENLVIHERIPFDQTIPLTADAKIVLNIMPWFKAGVHDRVFTAMLNRCVCLTDSSEYMDRFLTDGKNVLLFSLTNLDALAEKIREYLAQPEKLKAIAAQGFQDANHKQTWFCRAEQLVSIIENAATP